MFDYRTATVQERWAHFEKQPAEHQMAALRYAVAHTKLFKGYNEHPNGGRRGVGGGFIMDGDIVLMGTVIRICVVCGKPFPPVHRASQTCSKACSGTLRRGPDWEQNRARKVARNQPEAMAVRVERLRREIATLEARIQEDRHPVEVS